MPVERIMSLFYLCYALVSNTERIRNAVNTAIDGGGKIRFMLDEVNVPDALIERPKEECWTCWELRQTRDTQKWRSNANFYECGEFVSPY